MLINKVSEDFLILENLKIACSVQKLRIFCWMGQILASYGVATGRVCYQLGYPVWFLVSKIVPFFSCLYDSTPLRISLYIFWNYK